MSKSDLTIVINTFNSDEKIYSCLVQFTQTIKFYYWEFKQFTVKKLIEKDISNVTCELTGDNLDMQKVII